MKKNIQREIPEKAILFTSSRAVIAVLLRSRHCNRVACSGL